MGIAGGFLAVLFGLFVAIMFGDQLSCIFENTSTIDDLKRKSGMVSEDEELKGEQAAGRSGWENLKEIMGSINSPVDIWWLYPTSIERKLVIEREYD